MIENQPIKYYNDIIDCTVKEKLYETKSHRHGY